MRHFLMLFYFFCAHGAGISGQLLFSFCVLYSPNEFLATEILSVVVYSSLLASVSRLGLDNYIVARYRNSVFSQKTFAIASSYVLSNAILLIIITILYAINLDLISRTNLKTIFFVTFLLNINVFTALFLVVNQKPKLSIILRGNIVFLPAAFYSYFGQHLSTFIIFVSVLIILSSSFILLKYSQHLSLNQFKLMRMRQWTYVYLMKSHLAIFYGIMNIFWANWLFLLSDLGINSIDVREINVFQRVLNAAKGLAQSIFLNYSNIFGHSISSLILLLLCIIVSISVFVFNVTNFFTSIALITFIVVWFEINRVSLLNENSYKILNMQIIILLFVCIFVQDTYESLLNILSIGIFLATLLQNRLIFRK